MVFVTAIGISIVVVFVTVALSYLRGVEKGNDSLLAGVIAVAATFLGVYLAMWVSSRHQESTTRDPIRNMIRAVREELIASKNALTEPGDQAINLLGAGPNRIRDNPSPTLPVLLSSKEFIERADPRIVVDLTKINAAFSWVSRSHGSTTVYMDERGDQDRIVSRISIAIDLLALQNDLFHGLVSSAEAAPKRVDIHRQYGLPARSNNT